MILFIFRLRQFESFDELVLEGRSGLFQIGFVIMLKLLFLLTESVLKFGQFLKMVLSHGFLLLIQCIA